jgi:hypothetical protein
MAVVIGGSQGLVTAWNAGDNSPADRLLSLQAQEGLAGSWLPDSGTVLARVLGLETAQIDVGVNVFGDGVTNGTQTLTSASAPFAAAMVGLPITVFGHGRRVIETWVSASQVTVSGPAMAAGTGVRFTQPLGISAFLDGVTNGTNDLTSASAPFTAAMVGRRTSIEDLGTREITAFTSATQITVDGSPLPAATGLRFTVPVFVEAADRRLLAGAKVIDSHRSPPANVATVVRWRVGRR